MKIAVGLSGGVDSTVAALLLQRTGHEIVGVMMTLGRPNEREAVEGAKGVAERLKIPFVVHDFSAEWKAAVLDYLSDTYRAGRTPNPCVRCNEVVKFGLLPRWAFAELGCERFATGHYARIENGQLLRGLDSRKDQSYFLYRVAPEILARTIFPLGTLSKRDVRAVGHEAGFEVADAGESQDFCGGTVQTLLARSPQKGLVRRASDGKVLGTHLGYWNYTVGMRKGLGIGGGTPYYVVGIDAEKNEVRVGFQAESIRYDFELADCVGRIDKTLPVKVRSAGEPRLLKNGIAGIAPGQSAVFYEGDRVVGGGIIQ